jgi:hypothetical protein
MRHPSCADLRIFHKGFSAFMQQRKQANMFAQFTEELCSCAKSFDAGGRIRTDELTERAGLEPAAFNRSATPAFYFM